MRILLISASNPLQSSGVVASDLYKHLRNTEGNEVTLLVKPYGRYNDQNIISFDSYISHYITAVKRKIRKMKMRVMRVDPDYHFFDYDQTKTFYSTSALLKKVSHKPDAIVVLFMTNFISFKNLRELNERTGAKIYLYPMDMEILTGGCHYSWNCRGYTMECGKCPALLSNDRSDQSHRNLIFKADRIENCDVTVFASNSQLSSQLSSSRIFKNKKIVNGIYPVPDKTVFKPLDRKKAREHFGIKPDRLLFFFGSVSLAERRKGITVLIEALKILDERLKDDRSECARVSFLIAGSDKQKIEISFDHQYIGYLKSYHDLALAYNAADYFICPSVEDAGPTMILQSVLCGTPTVSFNIGYAADLIRDNVSGFVSDQKDPQALSESIYKAIATQPHHYEKMRADVKCIADSIDNKTSIEKINSYLNSNG